MWSLVGLFIVYFLAKLLWSAFQHMCVVKGISEGRGAARLLGWIAVISFAGFVGLVLLAAYLSH